MGSRRSLVSVLVVMAGAGLGVWWMQLPPSGSVKEAAGGRVEPQVGEPTEKVPSPPPPAAAVPLDEPSRRPVGEGRSGDSPEPSRPDPQLQAFLDHADKAAPRLRRAARILQHADPPVYGEIATGLADRLEAVTVSTSLGERQELAVEQRQLVEHLQRRYDGLEGLEPLLQQLASGLDELDASITEVGPSPEPRSRSAESPDALDRQ